MPDDPGYAERWQEKLAWYARQGIEQWHETERPDGQLIVTQDAGGRLDASRVKEIIRTIFSG